jgi:hypothetical protein
VVCGIAIMLWSPRSQAASKQAASKQVLPEIA